MYSNLYRQARRFYPGGSVLQKRLQELERTQWLSRGELEAWQLEKIQRLVKYAYDHVPYYHDQYKRLGICPEEIRSFKDFQALPFLTREDVNNNLDRLVSPELRAIALPSSTGGSSGEPMRFYVEKAFSYWDNALELRGRSWYGVHEGDKIAWVWGAERDMYNWNWKARLKAAIMRERYLNAFDMTEEKMRTFAQMLIRWRPSMFRAYSSALSLLAECMNKYRITGIRPKLIETTSEKVTIPQRQLLEDVFQCPVADWYSARELGTIAFQCPNKGLHVGETRYLEVVAKGKPVQPGEMGEVVITSTHQFAMPFIRYKLGDMAILDHEPCPCGRGLPTLREVVGRIVSFIVTADGHFVDCGYFDEIFENRREIFRFQVYQPDVKHLEVSFVLRKDVDSSWLENLRKELQHRFGEGMQIELKVVDHFELTQAGKYRSVISDVKPDFVE